jgi:hypothetical protein
MSTRQNLIIEEAKKYIGYAYRDLGRTANGVDCIGYSKLILKRIDYPFEPPNNYARNSVHPEELKAEMLKWFHKLPNRMDFKNGDFGMFHEKYHPCHIGLIERDTSGVQWLLHACRKKQRVLRERMNPTLISKLVSTYRLRGI